MQLSIHNHALLRGILAGVVALAGATACSRSDRADVGRDSTQSGAIDTSAVAADTGAASTSQARTADTGNSAVTSKPKAPNARIHPGTDSAAQGADRGAAGYREMGRDTASPSESNPSDTSHIQPTPDSGVSAAPTADTAAASNSSVASTETSNPPADADTLDIQVQADTTTAQAGVSDSATVTATNDSTAAATGDSTAIAADQAEVGTDSVTVATGDANATTSADAGQVQPAADSIDATGAAPLGGGATGVDAVATMTRAGARCVVGREDSVSGFWDMADSPAALNPCGTGTMTLSLVRTGEEK